ncbi:hypothetical protein AVEN_162956-1 [Araneus ventricosus]|uniref:Ionotropic glutamate receptor L-glutamate and glycine-binding domain-containing protein n=1 Tax=Araneus ventricosus TaxID=182803 RepID=A0A4Y2C191_ARAVE|nr:hypothetical protein AVEN_162956-1 [Araneus ventricosus]
MTCSSVLRVATIHSSEMEILRKEDGRIELSGIEGKFLHLILETLNLQLKIVIAEDGEWGRLLRNGSWTGMIGKIQQNNADMAINFIAMTEPRTRVVDFSTVYFTDDVTFAIEKQGFASTSSAFIRPFAWSFWTVMFIVLFLMSLLFRFMLCAKDSYLNLLLKMLGAILKQSFGSKNNSFPHRILVITWLIYAMIISFSYSSVLLSILTIPSQIPTVQNFEELSDAVVTQNYGAFFDKGSFVLDYLLQQETKYLRMLAESSIRNNWSISTHSLLFTPQLNKQSAMVTARVVLQVAAGPEEWKWHFLSDDTILTYIFGIAMKKDFCHKKRVNTLISRVNSAGLYLKIMSDETFQLWLSHPEKRRTIDISVRPLSFTDVIGAFALYLTALSISFLVVIIEIVGNRFLYFFMQEKEM